MIDDHGPEWHNSGPWDSFRRFDSLERFPPPLPV